MTESNGFENCPLKSMEGLILSTVERDEECHTFFLIFENACLACNCLFETVPGDLHLESLIGKSVIKVEQKEFKFIDISFSNEELLRLDILTPDGYDDYAPEKLQFVNNRVNPPIDVIVTNEDLCIW
ncbi:hypothetical protein BH11CYA1_BH11CYA1_40400 [soil metagenome]